MLKPIEYAVADTPELCAGIGMDWQPPGYALLFCEDEDGSHVTALSDDIEYLELIKDYLQTRRGAAFEVPAEKFLLRRSGWPDEW